MTQMSIDWSATRDELAILGADLHLLTNLDWLSPAWGLAGELSGLTSAILVPQACGRSGYEIALYLIRSGVMVYGIDLVNETFLISVAREHTERARRILAAAGMLAEE